jgi:hypothetical protein
MFVPTLVALTVIAAACGSSKDSISGSSASSTTRRTTTTSAPDGDGTAEPVLVYFVHAEKVATAGATAEAEDQEQGAVEALLAGPDGFEANIGMSTAIPMGTRLRGLKITDGTATVDLSRHFASGGGSLSMQERVAQVVFTLTQFDDVQTVRFAIDGEPVTTIGGEGLMVDGVDRSDFIDVTPLVLVEHPVPNERIASPITVSGISNTFEANVRYTITDPDGLILVDDHTTATSGSGTWGTFSFTAEFTSPRAGLGEIIAFESSAEDGAPINVYEVPVRMG